MPRVQKLNRHFRHTPRAARRVALELLADARSLQQQYAILGHLADLDDWPLGAPGDELYGAAVDGLAETVGLLEALAERLEPGVGRRVRAASREAPTPDVCERCGADMGDRPALMHRGLCPPCEFGGDAAGCDGR